MSYQLVIAEKPSVARSIAGVIGADKKQDGYMEGNGYLVSWCIGHLVSLADAGTYDERFKKWRYDDLPILPQEWQYIIPDDKKKQFDTLRSLMERPDVTGLVCATDAGREGELIFRFVYRMAGCKKPFQRLWISSMEDAAIKDGFAHLKPGTDYDNLYQSALCRAQADWLVGINATRLFSILYHKTLTVGRVQTPTVKMLVDREAKISSFQKEKYHIVQIAAGGMEAASERMGNADDAKTLKAACETAQAVCVSVTREKKTEQPPRLYDLTTLQREANRLFGFTAKQTLDYAQQLYEKKLLTYPRTDSQYLTDDMLPTAESLVSGLWPLLPFAAGLDLTRGLIANYSQISEDAQKLFQAERVVIGKCPRCGESVYEGKKNYYCGNRSCQFVMWKNDRFFEERGKAFTPKIAAALLKDGKAYLRQKGLSTVEDLEAFLESSGKSAADYRNQMKPKEARSKVIDGILASRTDCKECKPVYEKYQKIFFKKTKEKFKQEHPEVARYAKAAAYLAKHPDDKDSTQKELQEEQETLLEEIAELKVPLTEVQEDLKKLRDIRYWVRKATPGTEESKEPPKKQPIKEVLQDKADEKKAQRTVPAQTKHKQQDMEL